MNPHLGNPTTYGSDIAGISACKPIKSRLNTRYGQPVSQAAQPTVEYGALDQLDHL